MKIYKIKKSLPIIFEHNEFKDDISVDISLIVGRSYRGYMSLAEVSADIVDCVNRLNEETLIKRSTRKYTISIVKGFLHIRDDYDGYVYVSVVCKEDGKLVAYITSDVSMFRVPASILTLSNKFVKAYGVKLKDFQYIEKAEFMKKFCLPFELTLDDYNEENQRILSSNFLKEELTKLNVA